MDKKEEFKQGAMPLTDDSMEKITGGGTYKYGEYEFTRVYSGTNCFKRYGSQSKQGFEMAPCPNALMHPAYWHWWVYSTEGECGCCQHLYIDGAGTGICWSEWNGICSWPPDYKDRC